MSQNELHIKSGMKISSSYFDEFKHNLLNFIDMEEKLSVKKAGLKSPDQYFETSKKAILKATTHRVSRIGIWQYVAASWVLFLLSSIWIYISYNQSNRVTFSDLTSSEIQHYLNETYLEDKPYLIMEYLQNEGWDDLMAIENTNVKNIEEYLSEYDYNFEEYY